MKRMLIAVFATVLIAGADAQAQEQCPDLSQQLIAAISAKFPCPASTAKLPRFERAIANRLKHLRNGFRYLGRAVRMRDLVEKNAIFEQIEDYVDQCRASLSGGSPSDPPAEPPSGEPPVGGLAMVCASTSSILPGQMLIKSEASNHIHNGDPRTTGYTLVCGSQCTANLRRSDFFYADGSYAGSVGYYGRFSGNGQPRLYGAAGGAPQHFASQIAAKASGIGNGMLYLQVSSATEGAGTECKEFAPGGRNGSL